MSVSNEFTYKAKVTRHNGWQKYKRARFGISVGMPYHEGEKLRAALEWARTRFEAIEIRVSDTLQRYNMPGRPEDNIVAAKTAGTEWIKRHQKILLSVPGIYLFRWDEILGDPAFSKYRLEITNRIETDPSFKQSLESDIAIYSNRTGRDVERCLEFVCEELAAFSLLQDIRPAAEIYPGSFLKSRMLLRPDFNMTRIDFLRVPQQKHDIAA